MSEKWYAVQFNPYYEEKVVSLMSESAMEIPTEVNIFNPHYLTVKNPREKVPMKSKYKSSNKIISTQLYEGYIFIFIDDYDIEDFSKVLHSKAGKYITSIFKSPIPDSEIDLAFETVLSMKKNNTIDPVSDINKKVSIFDKCEVVDGALKGTNGVVKDINDSRQTAKLSVSAFGRNTSIEVPLSVLKVI